MNTAPKLDSIYLHSAGRNVTVPFKVQVECDGRSFELNCIRLLRILPGKRLVCLAIFKGRQVVAKFFLDSGSAKKHYASEKDGLRALRESGIKTPSVTFSGIIKPDYTPVLGLEKIEPGRDFVQAWDQAESDNVRIELLERIIAVIAKQHSAGLKQNDLHLGNFLLKEDDVFTIDGASVDVQSMGMPLSEKKSLENLGLFFAQLLPHYDSFIPLALKLYTKKRLWQAGNELRNRLLEKVYNQRSKRKKKYLKKIYRECTAFICKRSWDRFMVLDRDFRGKSMECFLADPDPVIGAGKILKAGNTATVALVRIGKQQLVVKRYNIKNCWHGLKRCLRPSRAWVSWRNAHHLALLGISSTRPIALLEKRWGPFRSKAYFISEYIKGPDAYHLLHSEKGKEVNQRKLVEQFVLLFQQLANASLSHGDFKGTNFIVTGDMLSIIDLDAMREHRFNWKFRRVFRKNLKRFMKNWTDLPETRNLFENHLKKLSF